MEVVEYHSAAKFGVSARWKEFNDVTTNEDIGDHRSCTVFGRSTAGYARYAEYSKIARALVTEPQ